MTACSPSEIEQLLRSNIAQIRTELGTRQPKVIIKDLNILLWKLLVQELKMTFTNPWVNCGMYFNEVLLKTSVNALEALADAAISNFMTAIPDEDLIQLLQTKNDSWCERNGSSFHGTHVLFATLFWESARQMAHYDQLVCISRFRMSPEIVKLLSQRTARDIHYFVLNTINLQQFKLSAETRAYEDLLKECTSCSDEGEVLHPELSHAIEIIRASIKSCQTSIYIPQKKKASLQEILNFREEIRNYKPEIYFTEETKRKIAASLSMSGANYKSIHILTGLKMSPVRYLNAKLNREHKEISKVLHPINPTLFDTDLYRRRPAIMQTGATSEIRCFKHIARVIWSLFVSHYLYLRSVTRRYEDDIKIILTAWENTLDVIFDTGIQNSKFFSWHFVSLGTVIHIATQLDHHEFFDLLAEGDTKTVTLQIEICNSCGMQFVALQNHTDVHKCCPFCSLSRFVETGVLSKKTVAET